MFPIAEIVSPPKPTVTMCQALLLLHSVSGSPGGLEERVFRMAAVALSFPKREGTSREANMTISPIGRSRVGELTEACLSQMFAQR